MCAQSLGPVRLSATPMDGSLPGSSAHGIFQASNCSALPFPTPGDLPDPGVEPASPASPCHCATWEALEGTVERWTTGCGSHLV